MLNASCHLLASLEKKYIKVDVVPLFKYFAVDVIAQCVFGLNTKGLSDPCLKEFIKNADDIQDA